jgi:group I intron endonuclease
VSYIVYMHTSPSGKRYVGITKQSPERRWRRGEGYTKNAYFYNAIQKYGWDNIKSEILSEQLSCGEAKQIEIDLIARYNLNDSNFGYNLTKGGDAGSGLSGMSHPNYGKHLAESTREKISKKAVGRQGPMLGRQHADSTKKRWSEIRTGRRSPHTCRAVTCVDTGTSFDCIKDAASATGANATNISKACRGLIKTSGGYRWEYCSEVKR